MAHEPIPPYPKNVPGDFYVENDCCIACEAPYHEAPDLMVHDDEGDCPHCYFKKQPETQDEVERAVMACYVSCVRAVRYAGKNPEILKRFRELGSEDSCDILAAAKSRGEGPLTLGEKLDRLRGAECDRRDPGTGDVLCVRQDDPGGTPSDGQTSPPPLAADGR